MTWEPEINDIKKDADFEKRDGLFKYVSHPF